MIFNKKDADTKQRFSIRKLTIGACSVLLSTLFLTVNNNQTVHASEANDDTQSSDAAEVNKQKQAKPNDDLTLGKNTTNDRKQEKDVASENKQQSPADKHESDVNKDAAIDNQTNADQKLTPEPEKKNPDKVNPDKKTPQTSPTSKETQSLNSNKKGTQTGLKDSKAADSAENQRQVGLRYEYTDENNETKYADTNIVKDGEVGSDITFDNIAVPSNLSDKYELAPDQATTITYKVTDAATQFATVKLAHKTEAITDPAETQETRTATVEFKYGTTQFPYLKGQEAHPAASFEVTYVRTATKDLVTGKISYGDWRWDSTKTGDGYENGYKKIAGDWTFPESGSGMITANLPDIANLTAWTKTDGSDTPTNQFVSPTNVAFYQNNPVQTVWYLPVRQTYRTVTEHFQALDGSIGPLLDDEGNPVPDSQVQVYYKKEATSYNEETGQVGYDGNWVFDTSRGDRNHPGFRVMRGEWNLGGADDTFSVKLPSSSRFVPITFNQGTDSNQDGIYDSNQQNSYTFAAPNTIDGNVSNNNSENWSERRELTTYYVLNTTLSHTISRTINIDTSSMNNPPTDLPSGTIQNFKFSRIAKLNNDDTGVVFGAQIGDDNAKFKPGPNEFNHSANEETPSGSWDEYSVACPYYTALIENADGTYTPLPDGFVPEKTVTPSSPNETVNITYVQNIAMVNISGQITHPYTGKPAKITSSDIQGKIKADKANENIYLPDALKNIELAPDDFSFEDNQGNSISAPTNVGTYRVVLNDQGKQHLNQVAQNNSFQFYPPQGYITYTIEKATPTVTIDGSASKSYDGTAIAGYAPKVTFTNAPGVDPVTLNSGDFEFSSNGTDWTITAPINVGSYQVRLTRAGLNKITSQNTENIAWAKSYDVTGDYVIKKGQANVELMSSGNKIYDGQPAQMVINGTDVKVTGMANGESVNLNTLTEADLTWTNAAGQTLTGVPTDAGTYTVTFNNAALQKLDAANPNYTFTSSGSYTYTIKKATATVTTTGTQSMNWTGSQVVIDPSKFSQSVSTNNGLTITLPESVQLTADDYELVDADGHEIAIPTAVGSYYVKLNAAGLKKISDAITGSSNYNWTAAGQGKYEIGKADATIKLEGTTSVIYTGNPAEFPTNEAGTVTGIRVQLSNGQHYDLKPGDLEFVDSDHTNVNDYQVKLSDAGLAHIKEVAASEYNYTYDNSEATLTVKAATASYALSGSQSETYKGEAYTNDDLIPAKYSIKITTNNGQTLSYTLKSGDIAFATSVTPINKDTYQVGLTEHGLEHLKAINSNFVWDTNKSKTTATFKITAKEMMLNIDGEANVVYDGNPQAVPSDQLSKIKLLWAGSETKPEEINGVTLTSNDFDYYEKDANGNWQLIADHGGLPVHAGTYGLKLKSTVLDALDTGNSNYTFVNGNEILARFIINQKQARVTLTKSQSNAYTQNGQLVVSNFKVKLTDTAGNPITVDAANLEAGDLVIKGYTPTTYPTKVGVYDVQMTKQLIEKLKTLYPDYKFTSDEVAPRISEQANNGDSSATNSGNTDVVDQNNDGKYIITPLDAVATLTGGQTIKYGQTAQIDYSKYSVALTNNGQPLKDAAGHEVKYNLQAGDLKFETEPGNVGDYKVVLTDQAIANLKKLGLNPTITDPNSREYPSSGTNNYEWSNFANNTNFNVEAMPVNIAVANGTNGPQSSIYGNPISIDTGHYTISITTEDGAHLDYTLQAGDLSFKNGTPTTADKFDLELSQQGLTNIERALNGNTQNYKFNTPTSTATYIVEKATPTITITANGQDQKTYDGQPASIESGDYTVTITSNASQITVNSLNGSSLQFKDGVPTNVGTYDVELTPAAIKQLEHDYPNFNWDDAVKTVGQYKIVATTSKAELSGQNSMTYSGQNVTTANLNNNGTIKVTVTVNGMTQTLNYQLQDGDYSWDSGQAPIDASDTAYTLKLNKANVLAHLQDAINKKFGKGQDNQANVTISDNDLSGSASFTINPASVTLRQDGSAQQVFNQANDLSFDQVIGGLTAQGLANGQTLKTTGLGLSDFDWYKGNEKLDEVPTDVGTYTVKLNNTGLAKLKTNQGKNYTINALPTGKFTYTIKAASAAANLSGSSSKTFDGNSVTTAQVNNGNIKVTVTFGNETVDYTLQAGDYTWPNGSAPVNVGTTQLQLSDQAKARIQNAVNAKFGQGNVNVNDLTGTADFTINPFAVTITTTGQTTVDSGTTTIPNGAYHLNVTGNSNNGQMPTGWSGIQYSDTNFGFDGPAPTADTKSGTFTVNYIGGQEALQNLLGTNYKVTYTPAKDNFIVEDTTPTQGQQIVQYVNQGGTVITSHTVKGDEGSHANFNVGDNVPANWQLVDPNDANAQITIAGGTTQFKIEHKMQDLADDTKTVTRTIIERIPGASQPTTQTQSFEFTRTAKKDLVTGEIIYGNWNVENHTFDAVTPQTVTGYTASPSQIEALMVNPNSANTTVDVYYTQNPVQGQQVIRFVDSNGNVVKTAGTVTGTENQQVSTADLNLAGQIPTNWKLADNEAIPETVTIGENNGYTNIKIVHATTTQTSSKTVTRIINVTAPDGKTTTTKQEAKFTKTDTVDLVTNKVTQEGTWKLDSNGWNAFTTPTIAGYTPTQVSVEAVTPTVNTKDQIINITYTANKQSVVIKFVDDDNHGAEVSSITEHGVTDQTITLSLTVPENYELANGQTLPTGYTFKAENNDPIVIHLVHQREAVLDTKTITRTIIMNLPNGIKPQVVQTAELSRTVTKDLVTGKVTYGDWSTGKWDSFTPETVAGYTANPNEVKEETVNAKIADQTVEINYIQNSKPTNPINPTSPTEPDQPTKPVTPTKPVQPTQPTKPVQPTKPNKPAKPNHQANNRPRYEDQDKLHHGQQIIGTKYANGKNAENTRLHATELPQTGQQKDNSFLAAIGTAFASLGIFVLAGRRKKKDDK